MGISFDIDEADSKKNGKDVEEEEEVKIIEPSMSVSDISPLG